MNFSERRIWAILTLVLAVIIVLLSTCGRRATTAAPCPEPKSTITTTTSADTTRTFDSASRPVFKPEPRVTLPTMAKTTPKPGYSVPKSGKVDTAAIIDWYLSQQELAYTPEDAPLQVYNDTQRVAGGYVGVEDTVRGEILSRRFFYNLPTTTITNTKETTKVLNPSRRAQVYAGIEAYGNEFHPLRYLGAEFTLKSRNNVLYKVGALTDFKGQVLYKAGYARLIKFTDR